MQPLPTSIHSVTSWPSSFTVKGFSMSVATSDHVRRESMWKLDSLTVPKFCRLLASWSYIAAWDEPFMITAIFLPCFSVKM